MRDSMFGNGVEPGGLKSVLEIKILLSYLLGISPVVAQNNFFLAPTSVTTLVTETDLSGASHFRATGVGDISHLYIKGEPMSESGLYPEFEK